MGGGCTESVCEAWAGDGFFGLLVSVWGGDAQTLFVRFASPPPRLLRNAEYIYMYIYIYMYLHTYTHIYIYIDENILDNKTETLEDNKIIWKVRYFV